MVGNLTVRIYVSGNIVQGVVRTRLKREFSHWYVNSFCWSTTTFIMPFLNFVFGCNMRAFRWWHLICLCISTFTCFIHLRSQSYRTNFTRSCSWRCTFC